MFKYDLELFINSSTVILEISSGSLDKAPVTFEVFGGEGFATDQDKEKVRSFGLYRNTGTYVCVGEGNIL